MPRSARCPSCGHVETLEAAMLAAGWFRCRSCRTPAALPGSPHEVFDGPDARVTVLRAPSRTIFVLPRGTLIGGGTYVAGLFFTWMTATLFIGNTETSESSIGRAIGLLIFVTAGIVATLLLRRAYRTEQRIEVSAHRVKLVRSVGRGVEKVEEHRLGPEGLMVDGVRNAASELFDVIVTPPRGKPIRVRCRGEREGRWLIAFLEDAARSGAEKTSFHCPGCGAPITHDVIDRTDRFLTCQYCEGGFTVGGEVLEWGPATLPTVSSNSSDRFERVTERTQNGRKEWTIPPGFAPTRWALAFSGILGLPLFGGFALFGIFLPWIEPGLSPWLIVYLWFGAAMFIPGCGMLVLIAAHALWGRTRLTIDEHQIRVQNILALPGKTIATPRPLLALGRMNAQHATWQMEVLEKQQTGSTSWISRSHLLSAAEHHSGLAGAYRIPQNMSVPIFLITEASYGTAPDGCTALSVRTPTRVLRAYWTLGSNEDRYLRARVAEVLRQRLQNLGREAVLQDERGESPTEAPFFTTG